MQDIPYQHISVNLNPHPNEVAPIEDSLKMDLAYLGAIAQKKRHVASLIVNLYNPNICGADMNGIMYYCRGESSMVLLSAVRALLDACSYVESHEIYGSDFVEALIEQWGFRDKGEA